jgi:hypothetical protein
MNERTFNELERTYSKFGYTLDPNDHTATIGKNASLSSSVLISDVKKTPSVLVRDKSSNDPSSVDFRGPWAGYTLACSLLL